MSLIKKRSLAAFIAFFVLLSQLSAFTCAAYVSTGEAVDTLSKIGLLKGRESGFELDKSLTKQEAVTMLIRLLGLEGRTGTDSALSCPFSDVDEWARSYAATAYESLLVLGKGDGTMGARSVVTANEYISFILRALGYSDNSGDFLWTNAVAFAESIGLTQGEYNDPKRPFTREDAVLVSYAALTTRMKGSTEKLIERLIASGAIDRAMLLDTKLSGYMNYGKTVYTASEIYERSSAAAFFITVYKDEEDFKDEKPSGTGSGFFISPDGLSLLTYHELEFNQYARITTTDGRVYEDFSVVYYDGYRDIAMLRVEKEDREGNKLSAFPYIKTGDSDAVASGNTVYTLSNPLGLTDSISNGLISAKLRAVDDPEYPFIQFTAPISPGSSGGVLLNEYCEAIGVLMGSFTAGNGLNLAVPVNCLKDADTEAEGMSLTEVYEHEKKLNEAASLKVSEESISVKVGETVEVIVTRDSPGTVSMQYEIDNWFIAECQWGSFTSKKTIPIYITGIELGTAKVKIKYVEGYGNPEAEAVINVKVTR